MLSLPYDCGQKDLADFSRKQNMADEEASPAHQPGEEHDLDDLLGATPDPAHQPAEEHDLDDLLDAMPVGRYQWLLMLTCGLANATDAIEVMSLSYVLPVIDGNLPAWARGAMSSAVFAGMLTGALVCGGLTDSFGRRPVLIATMLFNSVFTMLFAATDPHKPWPMIFLRFLTGFGCGCSVPVVFTLPAEFVKATFRGSAITVVATFWMLGSIVVASFAWAIIPFYGWRLFAVACAMPPLLCAVLVYLLIHESPRFLLVQHKKAEATRVMHLVKRLNSGSVSASAYLACVSSSTRPTDVQLQRQSACGGAPDVVEGYSRRDDASAVCSVEGVQDGLSRVAALWQPRLWRQMSLLCAVWVGICFGWYGLSNWIPSLLQAKQVSMCWSGQLSPSCLYETSLVVALFNAPGNLLSFALVDRLGRKGLMCFSLLVGATAVLLASSVESPTWVGLFFCIFNGVSVVSWNVLDVLSVEVFPVPGFCFCSAAARVKDARHGGDKTNVHAVLSRQTALRGVAMGFLSSLGRVAAIVAQYVFSSVSADSALLVASCALACAAGATMLLPNLARSRLVDV